MTLLVREAALQARWAATRVVFLLHEQLCVSSELPSVLSSGHKHMSMHHVWDLSGHVDVTSDGPTS